MSWSLSGVGTPFEICEHLQEQFKGLMGENRDGLLGHNERGTVHLVRELIARELNTCNPERRFFVSAGGGREVLHISIIPRVGGMS
jgi:hypothetical protein